MLLKGRTKKKEKKNLDDRINIIKLIVIKQRTKKKN